MARSELGAVLDGLGSSCFRIDEKSQHVVELGGCSDPGAVEILAGSTAPWSWAASVRRDRRGNRIDYEYAVEDGQHALRTVRYTGFGTDKGDRRVEYTWESRPDAAVRFVGGAELRMNRRLRAVSTYVGPSLAHRTELTYALGAATKRSLLTEVTTCTSDPCSPATSLPSTKFKYRDGEITFTKETIPTADPHRERVWLMADYDGDGEKDTLRVTLNQPWGGASTSVLKLSSGLVVTEAQLPIDVHHTDAAFRLGSRVDTDFDLDGRTDIEGSLGGKWAVASWNGALGAFEARVTSLDRPAAILERRDFDADGRPDLLASDGQGNFTIHLQCPAQAPAQLDFCANAISVPLDLLGCERITHVSDLDGNGFPDPVVGEAPGSGNCVGGQYPLPFVMWLSEGSNGLSFSVTPLGQVGGPSTLSGTNGPLSWLDLNGDGAEDLIDFPSTAWLNRGGVFTSMPITGASLGLHPNRYGAIRVGDFDHDGRDELLYPATVQKGWCHLYGTSSAEPLEYCTTGLVNFDASGAPSHLDHTLYGWNLLDLELDLAAGAFVRSTRPTNLIAPLNRMWPGDHRGDGLLDVQYRIGFSYGEVSPGNVAPLGRYESSEGPGTFVARHDGPAPDLLVLATDGLGMTSSVAYAPLSAVGHPTCVAAGAAPLYEANRVGVEADGVHRLFTSSMYVVARIEREDGIGGKRGTCFQYENAWWHGLGRDFVGFEAIAERDHVPTDAGNDLVRTTRYHTRAPLIGRAWETTTGRADDPPGTAPLRLESSLWDARCVDSVDGAPAQACFPFVAETSAVENDLTTRTELSRKTTTSIYAPADLVYGNPTEVVEVVQHGHGFDSVRTVMAYDYAFVADWWIAKPTQKTVTLSTGTGPGQTRQVVTT